MAKLIVADDSEFMRDFISVIAGDAGHEVIQADSGEEVLRIFEEVKPDLFMLDIIMGGMTGLETLEKIMEKDPTAKVVMCSAMVGQEKVVKEASEKGAKACIQKPFGVEAILSTIDRVLNS